MAAELRAIKTSDEGGLTASWPLLGPENRVFSLSFFMKYSDSVPSFSLLLWTPRLLILLKSFYSASKPNRILEGKQGVRREGGQRKSYHFAFWRPALPAVSEFTLPKRTKRASKQTCVRTYVPYKLLLVVLVWRGRPRWWYGPRKKNPLSGAQNQLSNLSLVVSRSP